jgi:hypothetical protein
MGAAISEPIVLPIQMAAGTRFFSDFVCDLRHGGLTMRNSAAFRTQDWLSGERFIVSASR